MVLGNVQITLDERAVDSQLAAADDSFCSRHITTCLRIG
jgi:hypothetical protein